MITILKDALRNQFGAAIDMLENSIRLCPESYLSTHRRFFYTTFHCIYFLDYYLTVPLLEFDPFLSAAQKKSIDRPAEAVDDLIPDNIYSKSELILYVHHCRNKCRNLIDRISEETISSRFVEGTEINDMNYPLLEILLYNIRHTQHHVGQLNLQLRQEFQVHAEWSFQEGDIKPDK